MEIIKKIKPKLALKIEKDKIVKTQICDKIFEQPKRLLEFMLRNDIIALIVEGEYNGEIGLTLNS